MAARVMKGMYVSLTPLRCSYLFFSFSRSLAMRVMSTLKTVWTCGLVCALSTMRCAMMLRILVSGRSCLGSGDDVAATGAAAAGCAATTETPGAVVGALGVVVPAPL